jgi:hypothetical protein
MTLEHSRQIFEKYSNFKYHETAPSGSPVVPYGDMTTLTVSLLSATSRCDINTQT